MKGIEAIVVGQHDVSTVIQEQCQHVIPLLADGIMEWSISFTILKGWMTSKTEEHLDDTNMTLVDSNVESSLSPFVPGIEISSSCCYDLHDSRFISKCCMMDSSVSIFVLKFK